MSDYPIFKDLMTGKCFISAPIPGDDNGHGGFKKPHYVFRKIDGVEDINAIRLKDGTQMAMPDQMPIIEVE